MEASQVSKTIAEQMGGVGRLRLMLGAQLVGVENGLRIKWPSRERSRGNVCVVTLTPADTYRVEFFNATKTTCKMVAAFDDVYCDQLVAVFERQTGWYLHF